jgi:hypothetical protein
MQVKPLETGRVSGHETIVSGRSIAIVRLVIASDLLQLFKRVKTETRPIYRIFDQRETFKKDALVLCFID